MVRRMSRLRQLERGVGGAWEYLADLAGDVPVADEHVVRATLVTASALPGFRVVDRTVIPPAGPLRRSGSNGC
jgi:hypothetical protein